MKNLKIRIWVKPEKKFYFMDIEELLNETFSKWEMSELEIGVFTGLLDKRGKEIYEGDIVKEWNRDILQVYYDISEIGFRLKNKRLNHRTNSLFRKHQELEVIGNIYENSELIK